MKIETSWTELHALAVKAALGAGVPPSQALGFGAMLPRHLADGGSETPLAAALQAPDAIVSLAHQIEIMIEAASLSPRLVSAKNPDAGQRTLLISWLTSLPCQAKVLATSEGVQACLSLHAPSCRERPARIVISHDLFAQLEALAARTYVPDSETSRASGAGVGAGAMVLG